MAWTAANPAVIGAATKKSNYDALWDNLACFTGAVILWPTDTAPSGFLECDGSSLLRATYAALFAIIGTLYGTADVTHFNLPDYRGRFLRAWDHAFGRDPDRATRTVPGTAGATLTAGDHVGTEQVEEFKAHAHVAYSVASMSATFAAGQPMMNSTSMALSTQAAGGNETRPLNTNVMVCIKF